MTLSLEAAPFFLLRTPLEPVSTWSNWGAVVDGLPAEQHLPALRGYLQGQIERPELLRAISIASPDLVEAIPRWLADPESEYGSRIELSLVRYFSRLCGRPTPFGLFAGCTVGKLAERTALTLAGQDAYRSHSRLDMDYLGGLARALAGLPGIREELRYRPNSSIYQVADRFRYIEISHGHRGRSYRLVALEVTEAIRKVIEASRTGLTTKQLIELIPPESASRQEALEFIKGLVEAQVLTCDLELPLTGQEPVPFLLDRLASIEDTGSMVETIRTVQSGLERHDETRLGVCPPYQEWADLLDGFHPSPPISLSTDLSIEHPGVISSEHPPFEC